MTNPVNKETLEETAARLYKDNPTMQEKWLDAVAKVRSSRAGWILDKPVPKLNVQPNF